MHTHQSAFHRRDGVKPPPPAWQPPAVRPSAPRSTAQWSAHRRGCTAGWPAGAAAGWPPARSRRGSSRCRAARSHRESTARVCSGGMEVGFKGAGKRCSGVWIERIGYTGLTRAGDTLSRPLPAVFLTLRPARPVPPGWRSWSRGSRMRSAPAEGAPERGVGEGRGGEFTLGGSWGGTARVSAHAGVAIIPRRRRTAAQGCVQRRSCLLAGHPGTMHKLPLLPRPMACCPFMMVIIRVLISSLRLQRAAAVTMQSSFICDGKLHISGYRGPGGRTAPRSGWTGRTPQRTHLRRAGADRLGRRPATGEGHMAVHVACRRSREALVARKREFLVSLFTSTLTQVEMANLGPRHAQAGNQCQHASEFRSRPAKGERCMHGGPPSDYFRHAKNEPGPYYLFPCPRAQVL